MRVRQRQRPGAFARVAASIGETGAILGAIDLVRTVRGEVVRDVTVAVIDAAHAEAVAQAVGALDGVIVDRVSDRTFLMHLGGKIEVTGRTPVKTRDDLSMVYTPGVARVSLAIHEDIDRAWSLTIKGNTVAVISDGTAVLGLGDIGPEAAMPVMEGKALLFKEFAGVDAFPLCLASKDTDSIVEFVKMVAPTFGAINLEDISAPRCFEIERRLREELDIPVFHDDQHGTAIVVLAALMNALRVVEKHAADVKIVIVGAGAAGTACTEILLAHGVRNIIVCDIEGALILAGPAWTRYAKLSPCARTPTGNGAWPTTCCRARTYSSECPRRAPCPQRPCARWQRSPSSSRWPTPSLRWCRSCRPIRRDHGYRSFGYPNQINNVLAFPGVFRGALDVRASTINEEMKLAAAQAIAAVVTDDELHAESIIPSVFNRKVVEAVALAVARAAEASGVARRDVALRPRSRPRRPEHVRPSGRAQRKSGRSLLHDFQSPPPAGLDTNAEGSPRRFPHHGACGAP